ncbi:NADP-dependent oxidoreductase [Embleya hyalina]|uniref:NADPH:quinone reductase n=1 Tax=Embleya hyalina TaxID=516124 RepID=A0A401Z0C1_9ACTN|nr:NADP-dependent oxidoreductase [Embleya hyalina]GCE00297.1 NADPH:quinone reductase [Embleya hyalina]
MSTQATMRAIVAHGYGPPTGLTLAEVPIPEPGPGRIRVRIAATALNPADLNTLGGAFGDLVPLAFPHVPGSDFAGTVTDVGAGVTRFAPGDEVFGVALPRAAVGMAAMLADPPSLTTGTAAEYAVFEADSPALAPRPAGLSAERAAALPIVGLTALAVLRAGRFRAGDRVLVIGATGGVGSAVLPLLAEAGVHVIATAGAVDAGWVRGLGAGEVVDHHAVDTVADVARRYPASLHGVVNLALPGDALTGHPALIRPGGRLLNIAFPAPDPADFADRDITVETVYGAARPGDLDALAAHALAGTLPDPIGARYTLADGVRAYVALREEHTRGKIVVTIDD